MEHTDRVTEIAIQDAEALDYEKKLLDWQKSIVASVLAGQKLELRRGRKYS